MAVTAKQRAQALEMLKAGVPKKEVATNVGISRATVFNWEKHLRTGRPEKVLKPAADRCFALPGFTPDDTTRLLKSLTERFPDLSADGIAELLASQGYAVEPRTIRKSLSKLKLGRRSERIDNSIARIVHGNELDDGLLQRIFDLHHPASESSVAQGTRKAETLVQGRVTLPRSWGRSDLVFELLIDTYDLRVFAIARRKEDIFAARDLADEVINHYRRNNHVVGTLYWTSQQHYSRSLSGRKYQELLTRLGITHRAIPSRSRHRDAYLEHAWQVVLEEFLDPNRDHLGLAEDQNLTEFNDGLEQYLEWRMS